MIGKIGTQIFAGLICLLLIFSFTSVYAASSQDFIQYVPDSISGLEQVGEPGTVDYEKMGVKGWGEEIY